MSLILRKEYAKALEKLGWRKYGPEELGVCAMAAGKMLDGWLVRGARAKPGWIMFGSFAEWLLCRGGVRLTYTVAQIAVVNATRIFDGATAERKVREGVSEWADFALGSLLEKRGGWDACMDAICEWLATFVGCTTKEPVQDLPAWVVNFANVKPVNEAALRLQVEEVVQKHGCAPTVQAEGGQG